VTEKNQARSAYAGLVTRAVAIIIDLLIIDGIAILTAGAVQLVVSLFGHTGQLDVAGILAGGVAYGVWCLLYFVTFWNLTGQTPGSRLLGIRVVDGTKGGDLGLRQSIRRFFALLLAALPLGAGFIRVLFDERRRGFHDRVARTVVRWVDSDEPEPPPVKTKAVIKSTAVVVGSAQGVERQLGPQA
jgi:uncharacterized RDD family membrane protein YckC